MREIGSLLIDAGLYLVFIVLCCIQVRNIIILLGIKKYSDEDSENLKEWLFASIIVLIIIMSLGMYLYMKGYNQ